jgi:hypothetical protein
MMSRTQISIPSEEHRLARRRAGELGISFAEYMRRLIRRDLGEPTRPRADISVLFDLGDSGGSDVANHKDEYIGDALDALHPRR